MPKKITPSPIPQESEISNPDILGQLIKAKRTSLGIKLRDCAALCGIGINTLSRIENGNPNTTMVSIFSVLNGLGITLNFEANMNEVDDMVDWV